MGLSLGGEDFVSSQSYGWDIMVTDSGVVENRKKNLDPSTSNELVSLVPCFDRWNGLWPFDCFSLVHYPHFNWIPTHWCSISALRFNFQDYDFHSAVLLLSRVPMKSQCVPGVKFIGMHTNWLLFSSPPVVLQSTTLLSEKCSSFSLIVITFCPHKTASEHAK